MTGNQGDRDLTGQRVRNDDGRTLFEILELKRYAGGLVDATKVSWHIGPIGFGR